MPILFKSTRLAKMLNIPYFPITANMLMLGPAGLVGYFPAKFKIRVLPPVHFDVPPDQERYSRSRVMEESERIREHGAGGALRHAAHAPQRLVRLSTMRVLVTGLSTYWGGRRRAGARAAATTSRSIVGLDTRDPRVPLERTEFVRADSSYSILARIVQATEIDTILHTHLIVDSTRATRTHAARDQRDRHDEPARRPRARRAARCARSWSRARRSCTARTSRTPTCSART